MRVIQFKLRAEKPRIPLRFIPATSEPTHPTKTFVWCLLPAP